MSPAQVMNASMRVSGRYRMLTTSTLREEVPDLVDQGLDEIEVGTA